MLIVDEDTRARALLAENWWAGASGWSSPKASTTPLSACGRRTRAGARTTWSSRSHGPPDPTRAHLAAALRRHPEDRDTALLVLTAIARRGDAAQYREAGFDGFLVRPLRMPVLRLAIAALLDSDARQARSEILTRHNVPGMEPETRPARRSDDGPRAPKRVLLAEDNVVNQKVALRMLETLGCRVDVAANGQEALSMIRRFPYHIVFMDCQMPEMDGFTATLEIRRHAGPEANVPIVALTANALSGDRERCLAAGMNDHLTKPVTREAMREALERWAQAA